MARIVMDPGAYAHMANICSKIAEQVGDEVHHDVLEKAPIDEGDLIASIHAIHQRDHYYVMVGTDHWHFPEYGTAPHVIRSHGSWQLRNRKTGQKFGWVVNHPGSDEQAYMRKALYQRRTLRPVVGY